MTCLNELYDKDKSQSAFAAYDDFTNFRRSKNASIQDYIVEFNLKYNKIKTYDMTLPDAVIAYYLLKCANLTEEQTNLCKATCTDLTYKSMRTQIEKVTSNISSDSKGATGNEESVNVTPQFYTFDEDEEFPCDYEASYEEDEEQHDTYYGQVPFRPRENNAYSGPSRGNPRVSNQNHGSSMRPRPNPPDEFGNPTRCSFCRSIYHWFEKCPDAQRSNIYPGNSRRASRRPMRGRGYPRGRGYQSGGDSYPRYF